MSLLKKGGVEGGGAVPTDLSRYRKEKETLSPTCSWKLTKVENSIRSWRSDDKVFSRKLKIKTSSGATSASAVTQSGGGAHRALRSRQSTSTAHNSFSETIYSCIHSLFTCWAQWDKENAESVSPGKAAAPLLFSCSLNNDSQIITAKAKLFTLESVQQVYFLLYLSLF